MERGLRALDRHDGGRAVNRGVRIVSRIAGAVCAVGVLRGAGISVALILLLAPVVGPVLTASQWIAVEGGSMRPTVEYGDVLIVRPAEAYRAGDIVTYARGDGTLVTHRVVEAGDDGLITQGDANDAADPRTVDVTDVTGRVEAIIGSPWSVALRAGSDGIGRLVLLGTILLLMLTAPGRRVDPAASAQDLRRTHDASDDPVRDVRSRVRPPCERAGTEAVHPLSRAAR